MTKSSANAVLVIAVVAPVVIFALLAGAGLPHHVAALVAVILGWSLSMSWARAAGSAALSGDQVERAQALKVAVRFGWICPALLVGLTWQRGILRSRGTDEA